MKQVGAWMRRHAGDFIAPSLAALLALAVYGPLGPALDDLGIFIIGLVFVVGLTAVALVLGALLLFVRKPPAVDYIRALFFAALTPIVAIPVLVLGVDPLLREPARFAVWSVTHENELSAARRQAGVFLLWDESGFGGSADFDYLASDPTDTLSRPGVAERWVAAHHLGCDISAPRRLDRGIYLLSTSDCDIDCGATCESRHAP